jgi:anti-sigma B factor antagonist
MPQLTPEEMVRDLFARYERDGIEAAFDLVDDDVVLLLGPGPDRVLRGTTELRATLDELRREGIDIAARLDTVEGRGEAAVASCTVRREGAGTLDESQQHWVLHVAGGRLRRLSTYATREEALSSLAALESIATVPGFGVTEQGTGGERTVRPAGELDIATAPQLEHALLDGRRRGDVVVLDLSGLAFIDSTGLRVVVRAVNAAQSEGWTLRLRRARPQVHRIFDIAGIADALPFEDR